MSGNFVGSLIAGINKTGGRTLPHLPSAKRKKKNMAMPSSFIGVARCLGWLLFSRSADTKGERDDNGKWQGRRQMKKQGIAIGCLRMEKELEKKKKSCGEALARAKGNRRKLGEITRIETPSSRII